MSTLPFDKLESRWRVRGELVAQSGLRIGAGKGFDAVATNLPVLRDANGEPYLPGSSLKGALRAGLERVLRGIGSRQLFACNPLVEAESCAPASREKNGKRVPIEYTLAELEEKLCPACRLFGSPHLAGRIFLRDLRRIAGGPAELRDGVGIDRDLGVAAPGVKYDLEVLPPGSRFAFEMLLENADDMQRALALIGLDLLDQGEIRLGGMSSRGLGRVQLAVREIARTDALRLLTSSADQRYEARLWSGELAAARRTLEALAAEEGLCTANG